MKWYFVVLIVAASIAVGYGVRYMQEESSTGETAPGK